MVYDSERVLECYEKSMNHDYCDSMISMMMSNQGNPVIERITVQAAMQITDSNGQMTNDKCPLTDKVRNHQQPITV